MTYSIRRCRRRQAPPKRVSGPPSQHSAFVLSIWAITILFVLAGRSTCLGQATEPSDEAADPTVAEPGFLIEHPFFPHRIELSYDGNRCLILRDDPIVGSQARRTQLAMLDLVDRKIAAQKSFDGTVKHLSFGTDFVCIVWESRMLSVLAAESLETLAEVTLPEFPSVMTNVADRVVVADTERWKLPKLVPQEPLTQTRVLGLHGEQTMVAPKIRRVQDGWTDGTIVYEDDLRTPIRFAEIIWPESIRVSARPAADAQRKRVSSGYNVLATNAATSGMPWVFQVAFPAAKPLPTPFLPADPDPLSIFTPERMRLQMLLPEFRSRGSYPSDRLLATIPIETESRIDLRRVLWKRPLKMNGNTCIASLGIHLAVVRIPQSVLDSLLRPPQLDLENVPLVAPWGSAANWHLKTMSGAKITDVRGVGPLQFISVGTESMSLTMSVRGLSDEIPPQIQASLDNITRTNDFELDLLKSDLRDSYGSLWPAMETLAGRPLAGVPLLIPYAISASCDDGSVSVHNSAIITEYPDSRLKTLLMESVQKQIQLSVEQAARRERASIAEMNSRAAEKKQAQIAKASSKADAESTASKVVTPKPTAPPDPGDKPLTAAEAPAPTPARKPTQPIWISRIPRNVKTGVNGALFAGAGALFLWMSFGLFNASCNKGKELKAPSFSVSLLLMSVVAAPIVMAEAQVLALVEDGVNSGWSGIWSFGALFVVAFLIRILIVGAAVSGVYHLKYEHIREVMTLFASFTYVVAAILVGVVGAISYGVSLL